MINEENKIVPGEDIKQYGDWLLDLNWYRSLVQLLNTYRPDVWVHLKKDEFVCGLVDDNWKCRACKTEIPDQLKMILILHHAKL